VAPCGHLNDAGAVDQHIDRPAFAFNRRRAGFDTLLVADVSG